MSLNPAEIDAYCTRIGYAGARRPSLPVLQAIVAAHAAAIAFENLDAALGRPIRLDAPALRAKLVDGRRGGYCFEHNLLLLEVLRALGFAAEGLAARVEWGRPPSSAAGPRTHMLLRVRLDDGPYLADVGFGGLTPTAPLALVAGREQTTPHETFRLVAGDGGGFALEARLGEAWSSLYRFSLEPQLAVDYEVANWFTSTHPQSLFVRNLMLSRPGPGCRAALFNGRLTIRQVGGGSERRILREPGEFAEVFDRHFGIAPPSPADLANLAALAAERAVHPSPFDTG